MTANQESELVKQDEIASIEPAPEGWIQIPVVRGIFEIGPLFDLCDKHGGSIIGGYARWCCSTAQRPVAAGDCDIFPVGKDDVESATVYAALYAEFLAANLKIKHENNVSVSFDSEGVPFFQNMPTVQLIKPIREGAIVTTGTVEEILSNFDFSVVRVALNPNRKTATAWASFPDDEKKKVLRLLNIHCPISSLLRVMKYGRKGYYMRPAEAMKLFTDWDSRDVTYRQSMIELFSKSKMGKMSQHEIDELEALLRVD